MIVTSVAAAVLYGTGAAVEQRQAATAPESSAGRPGLLLHLARQPLWLAGIAAQIAGFAAHAVALRSGPLATVQMLVALELVVAVVIVRVWSGRPLRRACWSAALVVVAAIAAFLALTSRSADRQGAGSPHHAVAAAALGAAIAGAAAMAAAIVGLRAAGRRRAVLLALAAGLADSCSAVVTLAFTHVASHGPAVLLTSWTTYALVVCGTGNVLLTQTAYQTGRPLITLPIISAVTPLVSVAIGVGLLGETPRIGVAGAVAAGFAVLVTSLALAVLAWSAPHPEPLPHAGPRAPVQPNAATLGATPASTISGPGRRDPSLRDPSLRDPGLRDPGLRDPGLRDPSLSAEHAAGMLGACRSG
jgi:drug/metabolite transporter (DMT)-like permease